MRSTSAAVIFSISTILSLQTAAQNRSTQPAGSSPGREDVYVFRSISPAIIFGPEARGAGPCPRAPFAATAYDLQDLFAIETRPDDGQVTKPELKKIGTLAACLAPDPASADRLLLYAEGHFNGNSSNGNEGFSFINNGTCEPESNVPSTGTAFLTCITKASGLPSLYIGGRTISSVLRGTGYLSTFGVARFFKQTER